MASYIFPCICRKGILSQSNPATSVSAVKVKSSLDNDVQGLVVMAHSANAQDVVIGSSSVTASGAQKGLPLAAGDDLSIPIDGPAATEIYQISTVGTDAVLVLEVG